MPTSRIKIETSISEINSNDLERVSSISTDLSAVGMLEFAKALDFDIDRFSSPKLTDAFRLHGMQFLRKYFLGSIDGIEFLVVLSKLPLGLSINRVPESAWVFPLKSNPITEASWKTVTSAIQAKALTLGIKLPSVRRFIPNDGSTSRRLPSEHATLITILAHPAVWDFFKASN